MQIPRRRPALRTSLRPCKPSSTSGESMSAPDNSPNSTASTPLACSAPPVRKPSRSRSRAFSTKTGPPLAPAPNQRSTGSRRRSWRTARFRQDRLLILRQHSHSLALARIGQDQHKVPANFSQTYLAGVGQDGPRTIPGAANGALPGPALTSFGNLANSSNPLSTNALTSTAPPNAFGQSALSGAQPPNAFMQGFDHGLNQGAPTSAALNNVPPVTGPVQPQVPVQPPVSDVPASTAPATAPAVDAPPATAAPSVQPLCGNRFGRNIFGWPGGRRFLGPSRTHRFVADIWL